MTSFVPVLITRTEMLTREAMLLELEPPASAAAAFRFRPGQYLTLRALIAAREERRAYSICSLPGEPLAVVIKRVSDGVFSSFAHAQFKPGQQLDCLPPAGQFGVFEPEAQLHHHFFIAAGSGITPLMSMMRQLLASDARNRVTLLYGNRASSSVIFRRALGDLKDRHLGALNVIHVLSREHRQAPLFDGRIDHEKITLVLSHLIEPAELAGVYVCGPKDLLEVCSQTCAGLGVAPGRLRFELFSSGAARAERPRQALAEMQSCQVSITQDGLTRSFAMPDRGVNVLDAALAQGIDLPYACKSGVCSTCRCKCVHGAVEMDANFALEDYEVRQGFVLCCQSYPTTATLHLNYDQTT